jgi:hypothetical protein
MCPTWGRTAHQGEQRAPGYWHGVAQYGFMEHPDIPRLLQGVSEINALFATDDATWYVGHETIVAGEGAGMAVWQRHIFAFMKRNCTHVINHYHLPSDRVVEISRRVACRFWRKQRSSAFAPFYLSRTRPGRCNSTFAPFSDHSGRILSASLWLMPFTQGIKSCWRAQFC